MEKKDTINFFDKHAKNWDSYLKDRDYLAIEKIFERADFKSDDYILDVACGTGVLVKSLEKRSIKSMAIDISEEMIKKYQEKYPKREAVVGDYEKRIFEGDTFDKIIIFNAFPHFKNKDSVFENSYYYLKPGGRFIIAHSMNREELNEIHRNAGKVVKDDILISDEELSCLYKKHGFSVEEIDNGNYFYSAGSLVVTK